MEVFKKENGHLGASGTKRREEDVLVSVVKKDGSKSAVADIAISLSAIAKKKCFSNTDYLVLGMDESRIYLIPSNKEDGYKICDTSRAKHHRGTVSVVRFPITSRMSKYQMNDYCGYYNLDFCHDNGYWYIDKNKKIIY